MLAYVMQFSLTILYIRGSKNLLPDALSRLWQDSSIQERKKHEATYMHEPEDFVLSITRSETARQKQSVLDKSNPTSLRSLNPYAKEYKPIKHTYGRPMCPDDCVKISARNSEGFGNGSICEDIRGSPCIKSYRHENVDFSDVEPEPAPGEPASGAGRESPPGLAYGSSAYSSAAPELWPPAGTGRVRRHGADS